MLRGCGSFYFNYLSGFKFIMSINFQIQMAASSLIASSNYKNKLKSFALESVASTFSAKISLRIQWASKLFFCTIWQILVHKYFPESTIQDNPYKLQFGGEFTLLYKVFSLNSILGRYEPKSWPINQLGT